MKVLNIIVLSKRLRLTKLHLEILSPLSTTLIAANETTISHTIAFPAMSPHAILKQLIYLLPYYREILSLARLPIPRVLGQHKIGYY